MASNQATQISLDNPGLFPYQVDLTNRVTLVRMTEDTFRQSSFLDHRIHRCDKTNYLLPLTEYCAAAQTIPVDLCSRYIFHISHVGSTLMAKILGGPDRILALREPAILRWLAALANELGKPESRMSTERFMNSFTASLTYLSRKFRPENEVVIKATSYTNVLAERILGQAHAPRALLVYSGLPAFLATIMKANWGIEDVIVQAPSRLRRVHALLGESRWQLFSLSLGEMVAMSWVAEMLTLNSAARAYPQQVQWVDFDAFLQAGDDAVIALADHLRLCFTVEDIGGLRAKGVMQKNAKQPDAAYEGSDRARDITLVLQREAAEVAKGVAWLEAAASQYPAIAELVARANLDRKGDRSISRSRSAIDLFPFAHDK